MRTNVFLVFLLFVLAGCGYHPVAYYSQRNLGDSVYVNLKINSANTENSVQLRDLLHRIVVSRFQKELKSKEEADSIIDIVMTNAADSSIAIDSKGFTTFYRMNVTLDFEYTSKTTRQTHHFTASAYYDYAVSFEDPTITYQNRLDAIAQASEQCVDRFIASVASQSRDMEAD